MSPARQAEISERTLVPLGLVGTCLITLLGGAAWLTNLHFVSTATAQKLQQVEARVEAQDSASSEKLDSVSERLSRMEGQLAIICDLLKRERRSREKNEKAY